MSIKYLKTKAYKFRKPRDSGTFRSLSSSPCFAQICEDGLFNAVELPENLSNIWVVFTVKPLRGEVSFTITKPKTMDDVLLDHQGLVSDLREIEISPYIGVSEFS